MTGREKCNKLKRIRAALADTLGIDLHQVECTFEGECTGTCPKCKQEEDALNGAILHKGAALAGAMMLATSMTACVPFGGKTANPLDGGSTANPVDGGGTVDIDDNDLSGLVAYDPGNDSSLEGDVEVLSGEVDIQEPHDDDVDVKSNDADTNDVDKPVEIEVDDLTGYVG